MGAARVRFRWPQLEWWAAAMISSLRPPAQ